MSREQYVPPTLSSQTGGSSSQQQGNSSYSGNVFDITESNSIDNSRPVQYQCSQCDAKISLKARDAIRCKECGGRVLYKERTNRLVLREEHTEPQPRLTLRYSMVQFVAR